MSQTRETTQEQIARWDRETIQERNDRWAREDAEIRAKMPPGCKFSKCFCKHGCILKQGGKPEDLDPMRFYPWYVR